MKQIEVSSAIKAYAHAKKVEENINTNDFLPIKAIVEMDDSGIGFYVVNKKDYNDAIIKGIKAIDNKSLLTYMNFNILDDADSYDEIEMFRKGLRIINKIWIRSIEF